MPSTRGSSKRPAITAASIASRLTKSWTSILYCAKYSAAADCGSASIAASTTLCGTVGFIVRVGARHTSTGLSLA